MLTVGKLKTFLKNWSDDSPVVVSINNKSKPMEIKRVGTLLTNRHKDPGILTAGAGLFCGKMKNIKNNYYFYHFLTENFGY